MKHREDEKVSGTYVTIEAFQMGIGTGSCGPATTEEFCYDIKQDYEVKFLISWTQNGMTGLVFNGSFPGKLPPNRGA